MNKENDRSVANARENAGAVARRHFLSAIGGAAAFGVAAAAQAQTPPSNVRFANARDFGAKGDGLTDDRPALLAAAAFLNNQGVIYLPRTTASYVMAGTVTFTGPIRVVGDGPWQTSVRGRGLGSNIPIFKWDPGDGSPQVHINGAGCDGIFFSADNNGMAAAIQLRHCIRSSFQNLWMEGLQSAVRSYFGFSNIYSNIRAHLNTDVGIYLEDQDNNVTIQQCQFDGHFGVQVAGNLSQLNIIGCDFEGFETPSSRAILVLLDSDKVVNNINIIGNYFEGVAGQCISLVPRGNSIVCGVEIAGNRFWGGYAGNFGRVPGNATQAIYMQGCRAIGIYRNVFDDLETRCLYSNGTNEVGEMKFNAYRSGLAEWNVAGDAGFVVGQNVPFVPPPGF